MTPWYEDDRFWAMLEPQLVSDEKIRTAGDDAANAALLMKLRPGAHVLDLGCGPGRHSLELAKSGFRVTGVDRTTRYLDVARANAAAHRVEVEYVQEDMRAFRRQDAFDGAINLFTSFGYFEDPEDDRRVLRNLRTSLRPGAGLVLEMIGKETIARIYTRKDWLEYPDGSLFLAEREVVPGWDLMRNRWIYVRDGRRVEFDFTHRIFSAGELKQLLEGQGFRVEGIYGALDGRPYDRESMRLVVLARV
jgi:SAM-dependent methyltransferase